jgi:membrane-bound serine protease (ClpP class)
MTLLWPIILQALAFAIALAEVIIPSFGILALVCAALAAYSWHFILTRLGTTAAIGFGIADILLIPIGIKLAFYFLSKSPISHRTDLGTGSGLESVDLELQRHVNCEALVDAPLRPTGRIKIGDEVFEAQTSGDFVDRGAKVKVVSVIGSRFQVEKI